MSTTHGTEPGTLAPIFRLPNANASVGESEINLESVLKGAGGIVMFTCNHCPYVVASEARIEIVASFAAESGLGFVGINSNDPERYVSDNWEHMVERASKGMSYPYLHDSTQDVAVAYGAERTPEFYLISNTREIVYRGRLDDSPRDPSSSTTTDLMDAIEEYLGGNAITNKRTESIGCSVKWKE